MSAKQNLEQKIINLQDQLLSSLDQKAYNGILKRIEELKSSILIDSFLKSGDIAPNFKLRNYLGKSFELKGQKKKIILKFIRGGWCPYCYLELRALEEILPQIRKENAELIAISPERQDYCLNTMERNGLNFEVLSDAGGEVARKYNLVFQKETSVWETIGFPEATKARTISSELPVPATFIIDEQQIIQYSFSDPDYRQRAEPSELLNALLSMN